jgi:hypothetical protein
MVLSVVVCVVILSCEGRGIDSASCANRSSSSGLDAKMLMVSGSLSPASDGAGVFGV